ncbi:MAG: chemotaxis protein CheB [Thermomicrobiales bacterium]|nr:chemotaxis protein CheB [Thermomicrobiales bacterium]
MTSGSGDGHEHSPDAGEHDIIAIGGSAGSVVALMDILGALPAELPAAIFVVIHIPNYLPSLLPKVLGRRAALPVAAARDGEAIAPGRVYVAPPDRHLLVRPGRIELSRGPRENRFRPAIDPLFRSAARAYGPRVVAVELSGALSDGAVGMLAVRSHGGVTVVQDPGDAAFPSMPESALQLAGADYIAPAAEIAPLLAALAETPAVSRTGDPMDDDDARLTEVIRHDFREQELGERALETSIYACPDCGGVLWQAGDGPATHFRCHVGHAYAAEALFALKSEEVEDALWMAVRLLKEKAALSLQLARQTSAGSPAATRFTEQALLEERHATVIRELIEIGPTPYAGPMVAEESA